MTKLLSVLLWLAIAFILIKDINQYVNYRLDMQAYERMAKKYDCNFLTPSASRQDVGMFECRGQIVFKKIEEN